MDYRPTGADYSAVQKLPLQELVLTCAASLSESGSESARAWGIAVAEETPLRGTQEKTAGPWRGTKDNGLACCVQQIFAQLASFASAVRLRSVVHFCHEGSTTNMAWSRIPEKWIKDRVMSAHACLFIQTYNLDQAMIWKHPT